MLLLDLSQVMISNLMVHISQGALSNKEIEEGMMRHMILNGLRAINVKFRHEYGELIICCDSNHSWRRDEFPYYKANRKRDRNDSDLDWNHIFTILHKVRDEIRDNFNFKTIMTYGAEADDIIGVICHEKGVELGEEPKILIVSGDKDFIQLHKYSNVQQFDWVNKKFIKHSDPEQYLREHILKGDRGDGIPNAASEDNALVAGIRQKPITAKRIQTFYEGHTEALKLMGKGADRNRKLVDLINTPAQLKLEILLEFETRRNSMKDITSYFIKHNLNNLTKNLSDFGVNR